MSGNSYRSFAGRLGIFLAALAACFIVPSAFAQSDSGAEYSSSAQYHQSIETLVQDQYPNRGGYSTQGYHPANNNSFTNHLAIEAGAGFTVPTGNTRNAQSTGFNIGLGGGWMFTPNIGALAEYTFNDSGIPQSTLNTLGEPGGNVHIWSLTLDPIVYLKSSGRFGAYATGGGGFYRKLTSYTEPVYVGDYCDYFYGCYPQYQNVTLSHFSSNQGGINIGGGVTLKLSEDGRAKFFGEARYVWVDSAKSTATSIGTGAVNMIPVTFGIRW